MLGFGAFRTCTQYDLDLPNSPNPPVHLLMMVRTCLLTIIRLYIIYIIYGKASSCSRALALTVLELQMSAAQQKQMPWSAFRCKLLGSALSSNVVVLLNCLLDGFCNYR